MDVLDPHLDLLCETLTRGHPFRMKARGGSMWPTIPDGAHVELKALDAPPPLGAVVAIHTDTGRFLLHRLVGLRADGALLTKGDNCPVPDGWFRPHEVVALVTRLDIGEGWREIPRTPTYVLPLRRRVLLRARRALLGFGLPGEKPRDRTG